MDYFEKGEDIYRSIQLAIGGVVADTADFLKIEIKIFDWKTKLLATYSTTDGTVTREVPSADGYISFIVPSDTNFDSRLGKYFYQVTTWEYDTDYPGDMRMRKFVGYCYGLKYAKLSSDIRELLCDEYRDVYFSFDEVPTDADALNQNTLLKGFVDAGIYDKCELIDIFSAHNQAGSLINWKNPGTFDPTLVNTPVWTQYAGFTGNAANSRYVRLDFIPGTDGTLIGQDNICIMIGVGTDVNENTIDIGGQDAAGNLLIIGSRDTNMAGFACNTAITDVLPNTNSKQHFTISRNGAALYYSYMNKVQEGMVRVSTGLCDIELYGCAYNNNGVLANINNRTIRYIILASYLTEDEIGTVIDLMEAYLTNYGTNLI